jgi:hypothetical protein
MLQKTKDVALVAILSYTAVVAVAGLIDFGIDAASYLKDKITKK